MNTVKNVLPKISLVFLAVFVLGTIGPMVASASWPATYTHDQSCVPVPGPNGETPQPGQATYSYYYDCSFYVTRAAGDTESTYQQLGFSIASGANNWPGWTHETPIANDGAAAFPWYTPWSGTIPGCETVTYGRDGVLCHPNPTIGYGPLAPGQTIKLTFRIHVAAACGTSGLVSSTVANANGTLQHLNWIGNSSVVTTTITLPACQPPAVIACSSNSDCGSTGYTGNPICQSGNVWQNYTTNICSNPGTSSSRCDTSSALQQRTICSSSQTCSSGSCVTNTPTLTASCSASPNPANTNQNITFNATPNGGTGNYTYSWSAACNGSSQTCSNTFSTSGVYGAIVHVVSGNQSTDASCDVTVNPTVTTPQCSDGIDNDNDGAIDFPNDFSCGSASDNDETLPRAQCQDGIDNDGDGFIDYPQDNGCTSRQDNNEFTASILCSTNSQCGTNSLVGSPYCNGNGVYQNYRTFTCNNPGTANSTCSDSTAPQFQSNCGANQTCTGAGVCSNNTPALTASCTASQTSTSNPFAFTFTPTVSGGTGNYAYQWSAACNGFNRTCSNTFTTAGTHVAILRVTSGSEIADASCTANVASNTLSVTTNPPTNILNNSATLNGYLNNLGGDASVAVWFEWGPSTSYGFETNQFTKTNAGPFNATITNLTPNAVYHFRAVAQNGMGIVRGQDVSFTAGNTIFPAQVQTLPATNIAPNSVTLNGQLLSLGGDTSAQVFFQWGTTVSYTSSTVNQTYNSSNMFSQVLSGLSSGTTYHFRAAAQTSSGTVYGSDLSFNTNNNQTIRCSINSQCGTNSLVGNPYCNGNGVYQNYQTFTCQNPGTANSTCSDSTAPQLQNTCAGNQTCTGAGVCTTNTPALVASCSASPNPALINQQVNFTPTVSGGTGSYTYQWSAGCSGFSQNCSRSFSNSGNYVALLTVTSGNQTANASCDVTVNPTVTTPQCSDGIDNDNDGAIDFPNDFSCGSASDNDETLPRAQCQDGIDNDGDGFIDYPQDNGCTSRQDNNEFTASILCSTNSQCGTNSLVGSPYCNGNGVYQNYRTFTCNNPGTANSTCSDSTAPQFQSNCGANQTCTGAGVCSNNTIACHSNADCSGSGYIGSAYCSGNNVWQNYTTNTCINPGTTNSSCVPSTAGQQKTVCTSNETCRDGACVTNNPTLVASCSASPNPANTNQSVTFTPTVSGGTGSYTYQWSAGCSGFGQTCSHTFSGAGTYAAILSVTSGSQTINTSCSVAVNAVVTPRCSTNSDCGTNTLTGNAFCQGGNVYRNYQTFTCNNPGTASSTCSDSTAPQLQSNCGANQTCSNGTCSNINVTCSTNSQCGTNSLVGSPYCQGGSVYQNYRTFTCNNPNTANSTCSDSTSPQLQNTCFGNQTCSNGSCNTVNTCTDHATQRCQNGSVHWFDSCGNDQGISQACTGNQTCSGNVCINNYINTCTYHSYQRCVGNSVYWFDSCGAQQDLYSICSSNQTCSFSTCVNQIQNQNQGSLQVTETVRNLSSGNLNYSNSVNASPSDIVQFNIVVTSYGSQNVNNVTLRSVLPSTLLYYNNVTLDGILNSGNIINGLTIGNVSQGQTRTITYQAQVATAQNFSFGTTTLRDTVTATSTDYNVNQATSGASVTVTRSGVLGATSVSTGLLSGNFWFDSFFIPLILALLGAWAWKSNLLSGFAFTGWINNRKNDILQKRLEHRISEIKKRENS